MLKVLVIMTLLQVVKPNPFLPRDKATPGHKSVHVPVGNGMSVDVDVNVDIGSPKEEAEPESPRCHPSCPPTQYCRYDGQCTSIPRDLGIPEFLNQKEAWSTPGSRMHSRIRLLNKVQWSFIDPKKKPRCENIWKLSFACQKQWQYLSYFYIIMNF